MELIVIQRLEKKIRKINASLTNFVSGNIGVIDLEWMNKME